MIPKLRAWDKQDDRMRTVSSINFAHEVISCKFAELKPFDLVNEFSIDDVILMQSTGLKDKNDTEIYEGDVVKVTDMYGSTDFCDGGVGSITGLDEVLMWYIDGEVQNSLYDINLSYYIKIIGNIYENPELLEDTKNE